MSAVISDTSSIAGFIGACLVDSDSGLMLASEGGGRIDLETVAAFTTQVVKAELQVIEKLGLEDGIEEILITLAKQIHLIRPLDRAPSVFLFVALERKVANLGMARMRVKKIVDALSM